MLGAQLDDLNLVDKMWLDALAIIALAAIPWYAYMNMTKRELKAYTIWVIEPLISRLLYLYIFSQLSAKSLEEDE